MFRLAKPRCEECSNTKEATLKREQTAALTMENKKLNEAVKKAKKLLGWSEEKAIPILKDSQEKGRLARVPKT